MNLLLTAVLLIAIQTPVPVGGWPTLPHRQQIAVLNLSAAGPAFGGLARPNYRKNLIACAMSPGAQRVSLNWDSDANVFFC